MKPTYKLLLKAAPLCLLILMLQSSSWGQEASGQRVIRVSQRSINRIEQPHDSGERYLKDFFFDNGERLQVKWFKIPAVVSGICEKEPPNLFLGSHTNKIHLISPRVDVQTCPDSTYPTGSYDVVAGISKGRKTWTRMLTVLPESGNKNHAQYRTILGASHDGIIVYNFDNKSIEVLSPETGEVLFPAENLPSLVWDWSGSAIFDLKSKVIYTSVDDYITRKPCEIYRVDLTTGTRELLARLPSQMLTRVPSQVIALALSRDRRFIFLTSEVASRLKWSSSFRIFHLETRQFIYEEDIDPHTEHSFAAGREGQVGLLIEDANKADLRHYIVK